MQTKYGVRLIGVTKETAGHSLFLAATTGSTGMDICIDSI